MTIIFYEHEYCEEIIKNGVKRLVQRDLNYLAKYWSYHGESATQIEENLIEFCKKNDPYFNAIQNRVKLKRAISHSKIYGLRFPTPMIITKYELEVIKTIGIYKFEKFIFAMLVSARFFKQHQSRKKPKENQYDNYLYSNASIKDIKELAQVQFTKKEWVEMKHILTMRGLVSPTVLGGNCWAIGFENIGGENGIIIEDYRNIIAYYQEYCGEPIIKCDICNRKLIRRSSTHRLCKKCWGEKHKRLEKNRYYEEK